MSSVKHFFEPKRIALIGSTKIREKVGMTSPELFESVVHNIKRYFKGGVLTIDLSREACPDLEREKTDLGVLMLPPEESILQSQKCAEAGVKALLLITGGFKNPQRLQLRQMTKDYGIRVLGPNTIMGVINTSNGLNTTFERDTMPMKGGIAVVSQSGGVGACLLDWACCYNIGISKFAFMGDKVDVDDVDLLEYFSQDQMTKVVCLYMEGVGNGREFIETAREVVKKKPVLAVKGGVTREAANRALSHTASIAGADEIFDAAFKKAGVIRVENLEELLNSAVALSKQPPLKGDNIAIVSNVGGPAILAADAVVRSGLRLASLSEAVKEKIENRYPGVDASNPIDLIADARAERYSTVLRLVLADRNVNGIMMINMLKSTFFEPEDAAEIMKTVRRHIDKPIVDVPAGGEDFKLVHEVLGKTSVPLYDLPEKAAEALKALRLYAKAVERMGHS